MKTTKIFILLLLVLGLFYSPSSIHAATEDGIIVDDDALNGGITDDNSSKSRSMTTSTNEYTGNIEKQKMVNQLETGISTRTAIIPSYQWLTVPHKTQANNYYCGPASVQMITAYKGKSYTQAHIAGKLGTTANAGTPAGQGTANALNSLIGKTTYGWQWHTYTDVGGLRYRVRTGLYYKDPTLANTAETPGDSYIEGHHNQYIYHFGVISANNNSTDQVYYLDPGYGRFAGFHKGQWLPMWKMSYALGGRGIAW